MRTTTFTAALFLLCSVAWADVPADLAELDETLAALEEAPSDALWGKALGSAQRLLAEADGVAGLYARVGRLQAAGVFAGSPWANPAKLQPRFVRGTLARPGAGATREALSCLRVAAIAKGTLSDATFSAERAQAFLSRTFALNLDLLFEVATEASRRDRAQLAGARELFGFLSQTVGLDGLGEILADEIAATCAQRPIVTARTRAILARLGSLSLGEHRTLGPYLNALRGPTPLSVEHREPAAYREALAAAAPAALAAEARGFGESLQATGLVGVQHAAFVQHAAEDPALLRAALGLDASGAAELEQHADVVAELIARAVHPSRPQVVLGLQGVLQRELLSQDAVRSALVGLAQLELCQASQEQLRAWWTAKGVDDPPMEPKALLLSGAISVLGQPLGVSQGQNQTCQSARGISLWSQRDPAHLLACVKSVVTDDVIVLPFEGNQLRSNASSQHRVGVIGGLDPVSALLTPHVDRLYAQIMQRVSGRSSDAHRWANPGLYGGWIPDGFSSCFTGRRRTVRDHGDFVRAFFRTFHPEFNGGQPFVAPNPVGITVTDPSGRMVGLHAISLLRVATDTEGVVRVYFFNPNGEDRQNWGQGIETQVDGFGEYPGESSLPFDDFATRIYAFHHDPQVTSDAEVPAARVAAVTQRAKESWGRGYRWETSDGD